ncbi:uncharacterized protein LOC134776511 [Penaeus indicus]|uniref:uncharacterized protein LOC134776511 n=1 Tax=Penaeus indicus TaxID=29960 RepID=UPI00300C7294
MVKKGYGYNKLYWKSQEKITGGWLTHTVKQHKNITFYSKRLENVVGIRKKISLEVTGVKFQQEGVPRKDTLLRYLGDFPGVTAITICFRLNLRQYRDIDIVLSYAVPEEPNELVIAFAHDTQNILVQYCGSVGEALNFTVPLRQWVPVCVALDLEVRFVELLFENRVKRFGLQDSNNTCHGLRGGGNLVLGQDQDAYNGGYVQLQSLSGVLAEFRLYDHALSGEEMRTFSRCRSTLNTNSTPVISFSNVQRDFEAVNVQFEQFQEDYCLGEWNNILIFPEPRTFKEANRFCNVSGGAVKVPTSEEANLLIFNKTTRYAEACNIGYVDSFWLGVKGNVTSQTWTHYITGKILQYTNFLLENTSVKEPLTCVSFVGDKNAIANQHAGWSVTACSNLRCAICQQDKVFLLKARGLCKGSHFDRQYFLTHDKGWITFTGIYYSTITRYFPSQDGYADTRAYDFWQISRSDKPSVKATLQTDSPYDYPFGRHTWTVVNDVCGRTNVTILITSCKDGQFSCNDGSCIDIQHRCNLEIDCRDESDEMDCDFLTLDHSYNSDNPPPRTNALSPVSVKLNLDIYAIRSIDVGEFRFTCDVEVTTEWFDSRLQFRHLNNASTLNSLNGKQRQPWMPKLEFLGDGRTTSDVSARRGSLNVRRYSGPLEDNDEEAQESEVFLGSENSLLQVQKLTVATSCQFDLEKFPFDTQRCSMIIKLSDITKNYVRLTADADSVVFSGRRGMLQYKLVYEKIAEKDLGDYSMVEVQLYLENLSTFYITSTYVPTLIIVVIGYLVFFFPINNFNERIMVGLTGLLVEATFFSQVNSSIPNTSYMKLVDIWMVFCILILFQVVVSVVIIHYFCDMKTWPVRANLALVSSMKRTGEEQELRRKRTTSQQVNKMCQIITPVSIAVFLVVYIILATTTQN